jgi:hypothetical protein
LPLENDFVACDILPPRILARLRGRHLLQDVDRGGILASCSSHEGGDFRHVLDRQLRLVLGHPRRPMASLASKLEVAFVPAGHECTDRRSSVTTGSGISEQPCFERDK